MLRATGGPLLLLALALLPAPAGAQVLLRDDVGGWGWLAMVNDRDATVQLTFATVSTGEIGRLDAQILERLQSDGVGRIYDVGHFDATKSQLQVECTGVDWTPSGAPERFFGMHAEISYWDHTRLAATEVYEVMSTGSTALDADPTPAYVGACANLVEDTLLRLGYVAD